MKKILLLLGSFGVLLLLALFVVIPVFVFKKQINHSSPLPAPTPVSLPEKTLNQLPPTSSLEKTTIGKTTENEIQSFPNIVSRVSSPSGVTTYTFSSVYVPVQNRIDVQNGMVIFESTSTYTSGPGGIPSFKQLGASLGKPEEIIQSNSIYGPQASSYMYPSKGTALIVNDNNDEVYEILKFIPMSLAAFKQRYVDYITPYSEPDVDHP